MRRHRPNCEISSSKLITFTLSHDESTARCETLAGHTRENKAANGLRLKVDRIYHVTGRRAFYWSIKNCFGLGGSIKSHKSPTSSRVAQQEIRENSCQAFAMTRIRFPLSCSEAQLYQIAIIESESMRNIHKTCCDFIFLRPHPPRKLFGRENGILRRFFICW